jgi:hypothetical protein
MPGVGGFAVDRNANYARVKEKLSRACGGQKVKFEESAVELLER